MSRNKPSSKYLQQGFTFIEILIIAPIVILTIGAFITVIVGMTGEVLASRASNVLAYNIQDALNRIEDDIKLSSTFLATNNITITAGQGYDNATAGFANASVANGEMLILSVPVTTGNPMSISSSLVYLANKPRPCGDPQIIGNTPLTMNVIYFVKNNTLWRRTVMPSTYNDVPNTVCNAPWQQPSCAPNIAGSLCKTQDIRLADGIDANTGFNVDYFNLANDTTANAIASDAAQPDTTRGAAMQATATVGVTINSASTVSGRDISQSATLRATRLDINASTIAAVVPDTVPVAPTVTATFVAPDNAQITWPAIPGASSYTLQYNINGGTWTTAVSNALNPTYTNASTSYLVNAVRTNVINIRVSATNSAGTSGYGTNSITIPPWNAMVLQNNWYDYINFYATSAYTKTSAGVVVLKGLIARVGAPVNGEAIAILPPGYRPASQIMFETSTSADVAGRVDIRPDGTIAFSVGSGGWFSLDGISFVPTASPYTWSALTLLNGWGNYSPGVWETAGYTIDSEHRVFTKGLIANGATAVSTAMATLPVGYRPSEYLHIPTTSNNVADAISIDTAGNLLTKGLPYNVYRSIQHRFYASGYPATWNNLSLINGWVVYPGYATPQYAKGSDGIVTMKGLIRNGATANGTVIATLPVGYRPAAIILGAATCNLTYCRFDINTNGDIIARGGVSATWSALEGLTFMAEQ